MKWCSYTINKSMIRYFLKQQGVGYKVWQPMGRLATPCNSDIYSYWIHVPISILLDYCFSFRWKRWCFFTKQYLIHSREYFIAYLIIILLVFFFPKHLAMYMNRWQTGFPLPFKRWKFNVSTHHIHEVCWHVELMILTYFFQLVVQVGWYHFTPIQCGPASDDLVNYRNPLFWQGRSMFPPEHSQ